MLSIHLSFLPQPSVREITVHGAPPFMSSVRALFVTDVHLRRQVSQGRLNQLIRTIGAQKADILLLGGDYGEGEDQCVRFFDALSALNFPMGVFAVSGNNDRSEDLERILSARGAVLLRNREVSLPLENGQLTIGGVDDAKYGHPNAAGLFENSHAYRILLSHFPIDMNCKCDLQLSGHTHGGQWRIGHLTPYSFLYEHHFHLRAIRGVHMLDDRLLIVGSGIGVSKLPLRVNADPEVCLLQFAK